MRPHVWTVAEVRATTKLQGMRDDTHSSSSSSGHTTPAKVTLGDSPAEKQLRICSFDSRDTASFQSSSQARACLLLEVVLQLRLEDFPGQ